MYLIDQHSKAIMEFCKKKAAASGLNFESETLEYIVTNRDLIELSPKVMIPTLYDFWVHDIEVLKESGKYKLYPSNPYETVINSRPAISYYNDNNPDWMNIMIFYHVLGHIDFFQNNRLFEHTWNDDFVGVALADKRLIESFRSKHGRYVDYVLEFARSIDNIIGYFDSLAKFEYPYHLEPEAKTNYFFNVFLPIEAKVADIEIYKLTDLYNKTIENQPDTGINSFFALISQRFPEFASKFENYRGESKRAADLAEFLINNSPFLNRHENEWMKSVITIVRNTAMYFAPQIRTKIINEGWASYWHDTLFRSDERIKGHEAGYAKLNAGVTSISRVGLNPYAIGLRLIQYVEELADKGKLSYRYQLIQNEIRRDDYNQDTHKGKQAIFELRKNFSDFMLINTFVDQDFVDKHNLFVVGKRLNEQKGVWEYYIKSRKAEDYKQMLLDSLYHPPLMYADDERCSENLLYVVHVFEGKQLVADFIPEVLIGLEFLWGGEVQLETTEIYQLADENEEEGVRYDYRTVLYSCKNRQVQKQNM